MFWIMLKFGVVYTLSSKSHTKDQVEEHTGAA